MVVAGDLVKGAVAVGIARLASGGNPTLEVLCAAAAVVGSARSIFLGFGGGRGVVTVAGTMLLIAPVTLLVAGPVFVLVVAVSRYVSLGSQLGSAALFPATLLLVGWAPLAYAVYAFAAPAIVWIAHADNIERLIHGTERKFAFGLLVGRGAGQE
jgi:glycerol-3-phosphate acyltransferase PlsY